MAVLSPQLLRDLLLVDGPAVACSNGLNLVCREWTDMIHSPAPWKDACVEHNIPLVTSASSDVDWRAHFLSASKSRWTRQQMMRAILANKSVLMTGPGGTGKTETIKTLHAGLEDIDVNVHVTAMTAAAASLIDGSTVHRWLGAGLAQAPVEVLLRKLSRVGRQNVRETRVLIIDEISMCSRVFFEKLDAICRAVRRTPHKFLGGIQLIASGDFFQLPPVGDRNVPGSDQFVFQSPVWEQGIDSVFAFEHIYRSSDPDFSALLLRARCGKLDVPDIRGLTARVRDPLAEVRASGIVPTRMHCHRADVDSFNQQQLAGIPRPATTYDMRVTGHLVDVNDTTSTFAAPRTYAFRWDRARRAIIASSSVPERSTFKDGAQVILTANLRPDDGLVNGSRGVVTNANHPQGGVEVRFACGQTIVVSRFEWTHERQLSDSNEPMCVIAEQIPLILGWASTIHRAQGMTLDCVEVSLGQSVFAPGMGYVALSRVRTLASLSFLDFLPTSIYSKPVVKAYYTYIEENGTHLGFLRQINQIPFPLVSHMRALAAKLPELTAQRNAAREQRVQEIREAEKPVDTSGIAEAYAEYLAQKKRARESEVVDTGASAADTAFKLVDNNNGTKRARSE